MNERYTLEARIADMAEAYGIVDKSMVDLLRAEKDATRCAVRRLKATEDASGFMIEAMAYRAEIDRRTNAEFATKAATYLARVPYVAVDREDGIRMSRSIRVF